MTLKNLTGLLYRPRKVMSKIELVKVKKVTEIFDEYYTSERGRYFFEIEEDPSKVFFYCPCDIRIRAFCHIDIKNNHKIECRNPLTISPSLKTTHGEGFCHFMVRNGKIEWINDSTNPRQTETGYE